MVVETSLAVVHFQLQRGSIERLWEQIKNLKMQQCNNSVLISLCEDDIDRL